MSERVKAQVPISPFVELRHGALKELSRHSAVPIFRVNRQRTEEAKASPVGGEVRADQFALVLSSKHG